ncbi:Snakin-2 [Heracleum sosnowskyi]|uniref:Snakin-2 n=1 Tax=Heracleum sosnowskyi TaxID=360622 RepID=A0AAD8HLE9_9APIA|nr:Snakin-2 [Heracleum sosnowskyi]
MAVLKPVIAALFVSLFVLHLVQATQMGSNSDSVTSYPKEKMDCGGACAARCTLSSRPRLCKRACGTCCARCNCVPPGTSGNLETCACYANMTTRNNKRKCP